MAEEEFKIELRQTLRGFHRADFKDSNYSECSIQESSVGNQIWLGCDSGVHHHVTGDCMARMHLTREQAAALIPMLQRFVETGRLN